MPMPMATATRAWKMRVRSSSRCSRKLIDGIRSSSAAGGSSVGVSDIGSVVSGGHIPVHRPAFWWRGRQLGGSCGYRSNGRLRGQNLALFLVLFLPLLIFELADFRFDLRLEL